MAREITGFNPALSAKPVNTATSPSTAVTGSRDVGQTQANLPQAGKVLPTQESTSATTASEQAVSEAVEQVSAFVQNVQRSLNFSIDEDSGKTVVEVFDAESETLIRQIPTEEVIALAAYLRETGGGQQEAVEGVLFRADA